MVIISIFNFTIFTVSIWIHREIRKSIDAQEYFTLNEGGTMSSSFEFPQDDTNKSIYLKREDLNPTGSWKDRGNAYKATSIFKNKIKSGVLASSGNAAISLITYLNKFIPDFKLFVVVSENINQEKLSKLKSLVEGTRHELISSDNPRKRSNEIAAQNSIPNFRSSIDDEIVKGYWSLGFELADEVTKNQIEAIFIPVSSGTAFVGIAQGLFMRLEKLERMPKLIAVQTTSTSPIADAMNGESDNVELSIADAIIDKTALRAPQIIKAIKETNGYAVRISNDEIEFAKNLAKENQIELSNTSALSLAAAMKDSSFRKVICIASGF